MAVVVAVEGVDSRVNFYATSNAIVSVVVEAHNFFLFGATRTRMGSCDDAKVLN